MAHRILVQTTTDDSRGAQVYALFPAPARKNIHSIAVADSYALDRKLSQNALKRAAELFRNTLTQRALVDSFWETPERGYIIEVGFLPGVTDNVAATAQEAIHAAGVVPPADERFVYSSRIYAISGDVVRKDAERVAAALHNPLIERAHVYPHTRVKRAGQLPLVVPRVHLDEVQGADEVNLWISDDELTALGKQGILNSDGTRRGPLALALDDLKVIRNHFYALGRNPTDIELESLAQTWSEHCKHGIFSDPIDDLQEGLYKTYIRDATKKIRAAKGTKDFCVSVFSDNSGGIAFDKDHLITHKVETHNTPSALDPFGGAITGILGVNRDALGFGLGAKPIANTYGFCTADPRARVRLYRDKEKTRELLSSRHIFEGVIKGVNHGGNQSGIPTQQGFVCCDERYRGKPLIFVGTVGFMPRVDEDRILYEKQAQPGDYIVVIGGRVGLDGIHGATFSSEALSSGSPSTAVQIGDPITQKKLTDALIREARDANLYTSITDNGAGGLSCSVAEMAKECGGCDVDLDVVPLKYPGLAPWQIWVSESQERMTLSVPPSKWKKLKHILDTYGVEGVVIGGFDDSGRCVVRYRGETVMDISLAFLHDGRPVNYQCTKEPEYAHKEATTSTKQNVTSELREMMQRPNIASFSFITRQYDHEVQGNSVTKPIQGAGSVNADATVIRPLPESRRAAVLSQAYYPWYTELDPYAMAAAAIDTAVKNVVLAGADPERVALLDNFCWCSARDPERLYELKEAARACHDTAIAYGTPFISGKDSMFNDFSGFDAKGNPVKISVRPTLLISSIGLMDDATKATTIDLKESGDVLFLLGETRAELGGSEYAFLRSAGKKTEAIGGDVPVVDANAHGARYQKVARAIQHELVSSAIGVGRGGLGAALAKTAIAGEKGVSVRLKKAGKLNAAEMLFSESQGRIVVSVRAEDAKAFERVLGDEAQRIGTVAEDDSFSISYAGKPAVKSNVRELTKDYRKTFAGF